MKIKIVLVDDDNGHLDGLRKFLEEQVEIPCEVVTLNPSKELSPSFEEFHTEIENNMQGWNSILLLDNQLGIWNWTGGHLAPSFTRCISISSDKQRWSDYNFRKKSDITFRNSAEAKKELLDLIRQVIEKYMPPGILKKLSA